MLENPNTTETNSSPSGETWVTELFKNTALDTVAEHGLNESMTLLADGAAPDAVKALQAENENKDPNVLLKNKLLAKLAQLSQHPRRYSADLLSLLERQATTLDDHHDETRYRQFFGLLDVIVECFTDEELHDLFEARKESIAYNIGSTEKLSEEDS